MMALLFAPVSLAQEEAGVDRAAALRDYFSFAAEVHVPQEGVRDVVAFGPVVAVDNPVAHDVIASGGTVAVLADVGGDVRAVGVRVTIDANVGGNVAIFARTVEITPGASISGSARIRAQDVIIRGAIAGDADITAETLEQAGTVGGELTHTPLARPEQDGSLAWFLRVASLFGMLVVGLVLVSAFPASMRSAVHASIENPARDFLRGVAALLVVPVAAAVLAFTIIGLPLGVLLALGYVVAWYLAKILVGVVLGTYLLGAIRGREQAQNASLLATMVLGVFVLWLIIGIPSAGGILKLVAVIWGLGMLTNLARRAIRRLEA